MKNVSNQFKTELNNGNRRYIKTARITLADETVLNLSNENFWNNGLKTEEATSGSNSFDVGAVVIGQLTLTLNNIYDTYTDYDFTDAVIDNVKVGIELDNGTTEFVPYTVYKADETTYNGSIITLKCFDNMHKFDRSYSESTLEYPATLLQIVQDACNCCGVTLGTASFNQSEFLINERPADEAITFRNILQWVGQIACCYFKADEYGRLTLGWYDTDTLEEINLNGEIPENPSGYHHIHSNNSLSVAMDDVVITGVLVTIDADVDSDTENITYQSGTKDYAITISGNKLIDSSNGQTVASLLGDKLIGIRFRTFSASTLSDPTREAGDIAVLTDRKGKHYKTILTNNTFQPGTFQTLSCGADSPVRKSASRYSSSNQAYIELRKELKNEKTQRELAIESLQNALDNSSGMYITEEEQPDGSIITYLHDKPTLEESQNVIKITADAIGISNDGGDTYPYGLFLTGDLITRLIYTVGINADYIDTGALTVTDNEGKVIFEADIEHNQVTISGDYVQIGGKTASDAISDIENEVANSKNLNVMLDNEFQLIPTDSEGNYDVFPECKTTVTVLYGNINVTSQCTFQVIESESVTGSWNSESKTYTVTALSADTGWVDIQATYLSTLSATKRFSISKQKQGDDGVPGEDGEPGRVYYVESSAPIVKIISDKVFSPDYLQFNAYYREGDNTNRIDYEGRFRIRETSDGGTWETVYESNKDENSVKRYLYGVISDAEGNAISNADGNGIAVKRDITAVEVTLYAAGGFETVIDILTIPIVQDVSALNQNDIFNLLTNNGAAKGIFMVGNELYINATYLVTGILTDVLGENYWNLETGEFRLSSGVRVDDKPIPITQEEVFNLLTNNGDLQGLYMYNGQLYINFSYGRGGILKLGGENNGNGELHVYNAEGTEIGYWTKDGFFCNNGSYSGSISASNISGGNISGTNISASNIDGGNVSGAVITSYFGNVNSGISMVMGYGRMRLYYPFNNVQTLVGEMAPSRINYNGTYYYGPQLKGEGQIWLATDYGNIAFFLNDQVVFFQDVTVQGSKSRLTKTENYGKRLLYCYETATPYFGDIGSGKINENGECYVSVDDIFQQTVCENVEYCVFLQKEGEGDVWVDSKEPTFFVVKGTPNLSFSWEVKAAQKGYEQYRLQDEELKSSLAVIQTNEVTKIFDEDFLNYEKDVEEMFL